MTPSAAVARVLAALPSARPSGSGWSARCPAHQDKVASLSVTEGREGRVLLKCHAGCPTEAVVKALGLRMADLLPPHPGRRGGRGSIPPRNGTTVQHPSEGCTLADYARAKQLDEAKLRALGIVDVSYLRRPALRIPYRDAEGQEVAVRFRVALSAGDRFRWRNGSRPIPYGLDRLAEARRAGSVVLVVLVEGESDCHTLWLQGFPALGLPGAASWREEWAHFLDGIKTVYVVIEPDEGGQAVLAWLRRSAIRDRVRLVLLADAKDASEFYLAEPDSFAERWWAALAGAVPWPDYAAAEAQETRHAALLRCGDLAREPDILGRLVEDLGRAGLAGEERAARLLYLAATSRLLLRPVSVAVKGPSSAGKSYLVELVLGFLPPSAYYALSAMSERALAYSEEPLAHRMLVIYEAAGLGSNFASYLLRSLLSEGRVRYETVEKTRDGLRPRLIEREGPTGLLVTTTAVRLHPENETRIFSMTVTDTAEQTKAVLRAQARRRGPGPDLVRWHALQEWLAAGSAEVTVPYAEALAEAVPPVAVRLRRDVPALLRLVEAHALLHQATRERDAEGRVLATVKDYAAVRELVADLVADAAERTVSPEVRATVEVVGHLRAGHPGGVSVAALAAELHLDKSSASRRAARADERGFLRNEEERKGRPARYVLGDPLPGDEPILPPPWFLGADRCTVAALPGEIDHPSPSLIAREPGEEG